MGLLTMPRLPVIVGAMVGAAAALSSCSKDQPATVATAEASSSAPVAPAAPPAPARTFSVAQWRETLASAYEASGLKTNDDGIAQFQACFEKGADSKCSVGLVGKTDGFRKVTHLTARYSVLNDIMASQAYVKVYIAAVECAEPILILEPTVNADRWLFMNNASIMKAGQVVLSQDLPRDVVDRDTVSGGIHERGFWRVERSSLDILRAIAGSEASIVRLTGEKGYITVKKDQEADFRKDLKAVLLALDRIDAAFSAVGGFECTPDPAVQPVSASGPASG